MIEMPLNGRIAIFYNVGWATTITMIIAAVLGIVCGLGGCLLKTFTGYECAVYDNIKNFCSECCKTKKLKMHNEL